MEAEAGPELGSQALPAQPPMCSAVVIPVVIPWTPCGVVTGLGAFAHWAISHRVF